MDSIKRIIIEQESGAKRKGARKREQETELFVSEKGEVVLKKSLAIALVITLMAWMLPVVSLSATDSSAVFYVGKNPDAGLNGTVNIEFTKSYNSYSGKIYLPGNANASALKLSWDNADTITVKTGTKTVNSGETPIPAKGESISYSVTSGGTTSTYKVTTMQSTPNVEGLFLSIDENYTDDDGTHTIDQMIKDETHESICYGSLSFGGDDYDMSIKGRGNWTWFAADKKPFNITLYKNANQDKGIEQYSKKKNVTFIDGVEAKKWSVLANYSDGSLMRNKITYDLACKLGIGLESRYIDIWMNGEYLGNYLMTPKYDYAAPDDGYMLELDNKTDAEDPQFRLNGLDKSGDSENLITVKSLGDNAEEAGVTTDDIQSWMQEMLDAVMDTSSDEYTDYIDVDSWAKLYLLQEYSKNYDILCGSIFMHRDGLTDSDKLHAGPAWDYDNAWSRIWESKDSGISRNMQFQADGWYIDSINGPTSFLQYLGKHESFMERVYEIYNENKDDFAGIYDEADTLKSEIQESANMNFSVWNVNQSQYNASRYTYDQTIGSGKYAFKQLVTSSWDNCISNLKAYIYARRAFLSDNLILTPPEVGQITGETTLDEKTTLSLTVSGSADAYQWQSSDDGSTWTDISGATSKQFTSDDPSGFDGKMIRCIATNKNTINTERVAKASIKAAAESEPVTITVQNHSHNYAKTWSKDETNHWHECTCGDKTDVAAHSGGTATCQEKAECEVCGKEYGDYAGHNYAQTFTVDKKASLTENGSKSKHCQTDGCTEKTEETAIPKIASVTLSETEYTYDGKSHQPTVTVKDSGQNEIAAENYDVTYDKNVAYDAGRKNAGTYKVTVTFKGDYYTGSKEISFKINKAQPEDEKITELTTTGLTAKCGDTLGDISLPEGFSWQDAETTSAGKAGNNTFKVKFTPEDTANYNVVKDIEVTVTVSHSYSETWSKDETNHWHECTCGDKTDVAVHSGGTATCQEKAECEVCGKEYGNLAGHNFSDWNITKSATCAEKGKEERVCHDCEYKDVKEIELLPHDYQNFTVKAQVGIAGKIYDECSHCHNVIIKKTLAALNPAATKITSIKRAKKAFTVKWTKKSYTGYQIRYSLKTSMKSAKSLTITKASTITKKVSKLKSKKKYYVQVRTYKKVNGKYYYSGWSAKKAVKTK